MAARTMAHLRGQPFRLVLYLDYSQYRCRPVPRPGRGPGLIPTTSSSRMPPMRLHDCHSGRLSDFAHRLPGQPRTRRRFPVDGQHGPAGRRSHSHYCRNSRFSGSPVASVPGPLANSVVLIRNSSAHRTRSRSTPKRRDLLGPPGIGEHSRDESGYRRNLCGHDEQSDAGFIPANFNIEVTSASPTDRFGRPHQLQRQRGHPRTR